MDLSGRRLGHIRVERILGQGGMGDVYEGFDEKLMRRVALKALHRDQRLDDEARGRLIREARTLSQLDHPNICRIHDYIEGSDADVLVLELIEGRTLQRAIEEGLSRAEKLRIAHAIAEVLVVAHRANIVHRDLKPENIMLTRSGQVKVLDFGLARWVERQSSGKLRAVKVRPTPLPSPGDEKWYAFDLEHTQVMHESHRGGNGRDTGDPAAATAVGVTVGTPMFMSPEQARGEPLTPASDMYSFGLLMQTLFTSEDPYPADSTGREVMLKAARGESLPVTGVNRDVAALIHSLKALAPTDRPTAVEAASKLRLITEKPKRMARRAALAAAVVLVVLAAWKYTVDLRRERTAALLAKKEAVQRKAQAEDLIQFMLGDLRGKLEPVGRLDVLNDVAEKALQYIGATKKENLSTQELINYSMAFNQLGQVRIDQGNLASAMKLFEQSLDLTSAAVRQEPRNDNAKFALALSHFWVGNDFRLRNDVAHAMPHIREYLSITRELASRHRGEDKYELEESYAHSLLGLLYEAQGDPRAARSEYETTLAIKRAHAARHPGDDQAKEDVARTVNKLGFVLQKMGELPAARQQFESEVGIRQDLLVRNPKQMLWRDELAASHSFLAGVLEDLGEQEAALEHRRADVRTYTELCAFDASNAQWRRNQAVGRHRLGKLLSETGSSREGLAELDKAEELLKPIVAAETTRRTWRDDLASMQATHAELLGENGNRRAARAKVDEAIRLLGAPKERGAKQRLAYALLVKGSIDAADGQKAAARESWQQARDILQPVAQWREPRQIAIVARVMIALGERAEAAPLVERLRAIGYGNREFTSLSKAEGY
jgi:serine/threonine-protein kinase